MRKIIIALTALCGGCYVQNGVPCLDWFGGGENCGETDGAAEDSSGGDPDPRPVAEHPCDQIAAASGLLLHAPPSGAWTSEINTTNWLLWSPGALEDWVWAQPAPTIGDRVLLWGSIVDETATLGQLSLRVLGDPGVYWQIVDYVTAANVTHAGGSSAVNVIPQPNGTALLFATGLPGGEKWWNFEGSPQVPRVRGVVSDTSVPAPLAGPSQGNAKPAQEGSRAFLPYGGRCIDGPAPSADGGSGDGSDTGAPEPDLDPQPEPLPGEFDPCVTLGFGVASRPAGYSLPWIGQEEGHMSKLWIAPTDPKPWHFYGNPVANDPVHLSIWATAQIDPAPVGVTASWIQVDDGDGSTPVLALSGVTAEVSQLEDGSWLGWVEGAPQGSTWTIAWPELSDPGFVAGLRGRAREDHPGILAASLGEVTTYTVSGSGLAFVPAAGYCVAGS